MKVEIVNNKFSIPAQQNVRLLYNHLDDLVKAHNIPADFRTDRIDITTATSKQKDALLKKLADIKANFTMK